LWGGEAVIDEAGGSGIGSADFGNTEGYLDNPLERTGFDLGCPSEYYPNFPTTAGANIITVEANTVKTDINFTVWDEDMDQSARISLLTDCPNSYTVSLLIGSSSSDPEQTIPISPTLSDEEMNIYTEFELGDEYNDYLPPSSSNQWFLSVAKSASVVGCSYKTLLNFTIKYDGKIYLPAEISSFPKEISNSGSNVFAVDGSSYLDEDNPPTNGRSLQFELPESISEDAGSDITVESGSGSEDTVSDDGANSTDPAESEEVSDGCSSCNVGQSPLRDTRSLGPLGGAWLVFVSTRFLRRSSKKPISKVHREDPL
jgi:hypothetical protein